MTAIHRGTQPLRTRRLLLRRFTVDDAEVMYQGWASDPRVTRFLNWAPHADVAETRRILEDWVRDYEIPIFYNWAIEYKGRPVGSISAHDQVLWTNHCEVGYCIAHHCWGRGIVTETLQAVLEELFLRVGIHKVYAQHNQHNPASGRVMQKCGMVLEGRFREHYPMPEGNADALYYGILDRDFKAAYALRARESKEDDR